MRKITFLILAIIMVVVGILSAIVIVGVNALDNPTFTPTPNTEVLSSPDQVAPEGTPTPDVVVPVEVTVPPVTIPEENIIPTETANGNRIDDIRIYDGPLIQGYQRDMFGSSWVDVDGNGCSTRNDILARDLMNITTVDGCKVLSGVLNDPYTGDTVDFVFGQDTSTYVQIDHVYSLSGAYKMGASEWDKEKMVSFANDPDNLVATSRVVNCWKSDKSPSVMLDELENNSFITSKDDADIATCWKKDNVNSGSGSRELFQSCVYVEKFVTTALKYDLPVTTNDRAALHAFNEGC